MQSGNLKIQLGVAPGGGRGAGHSRVTVHRERPSPPSVGRHRRVCRVMCAARASTVVRRQKLSADLHLNAGLVCTFYSRQYRGVSTCP